MCSRLQAALLAVALTTAAGGCFRFMGERDPDARVADGAGPDAPAADLRLPDAGHADAGRPDADSPDARRPDAGAPDGSHADAPLSDAPLSDAPPTTDSALPDTRPPLPTLPQCPAKPALVDTSKPDVVVGNGSPASCSNAALQQALNTGGTITFACGTSPVTIPVSNTLIVTKAAVIDGGGAVTLSGGKTTRILHLKSFSNLTTPKLTLQRLAFGGGLAATGNGGAVWREGGSLYVRDCTFSGNAATEVGGKICGGAIRAEGKGDTVIVNSSFSGNSAGSGGGVCVMASTLGGGLTLLDTDLTGNAATGAGGETKTGGQGGAIFFNGGALTICQAVISGNKAGYLGAGIYRVQGVVGAPTLIRHVALALNTGPSGQGGGAYLQATKLKVADTLINDNQAGGGAGMFINSCYADLINVTVEGNVATSMGGGLSFGGGSYGTLLNLTIANNKGSFSGAIHGGDEALWLQNTLIADNEHSNIWEARSCKGQLSDGGGNLQHPAQKQSGGADPLCAAGIKLADPALGSLQSNGGPTQTMAVGSTSPAAKQGMQCPPTDQRGIVRASPCTSGAYEAK